MFTLAQLCAHFQVKRHQLVHALARDAIEPDHRVGRVRYYSSAQFAAIQDSLDMSAARMPTNSSSFRYRPPDALPG